MLRAKTVITIVIGGVGKSDDLGWCAESMSIAIPPSSAPVISPATFPCCTRADFHGVQVLFARHVAVLLRPACVGALVRVGGEYVELVLPGRYPALHAGPERHLAGEQCCPHVGQQAVRHAHQPGAEPRR